MFLRMVDVDNDIGETALPPRGEVEHDRVPSRSGAPRRDEHRVHAMFALGEDYFRAGLFDRAERLFRS